jgi:hypothetical protein
MLPGGAKIPGGVAEAAGCDISEGHGEAGEAAESGHGHCLEPPGPGTRSVTLRYTRN